MSEKKPDSGHGRNERLLIVSPVRNEAANLERVIRAMARQTRPPDLWLIADDSSDDETLAIARRMEREVAFIRVVEVRRPREQGSDRLALALEAKAFNHALNEVDWNGYSHLGKLDGDVELPEDYFERLLRAFADEPSLGIAGGSIVEPNGPAGNRWQRVVTPDYHVHGALKLYSCACFEAIGGVQERLGWDTIDETYARMLGYRTRQLQDLVVRHHRPSATADGALRGRARHGECAYIVRYGLLWVLLRSFKVALKTRPRGLSGLAFLGGYLRCHVRRSPRVEDEAFRDFVRGELRGRMRRSLLPLAR